MSSIVSKEEFAQLVQRHASAVIGFAARLLPNQREAEEIAQDAFVKAFRHLSSFRGESSFLTWVQRIAYREALDHLRRRRPYMVEIDEELTMIEDEELPIEQEERIQLMEEAVDKLAPNDQLLLHLFYYEDRPLRDIAYIMDTEPNTLSQRLRRIRKKLMVMIKQKENEQQ